MGHEDDFIEWDDRMPDFERAVTDRSLPASVRVALSALLGDISRAPEGDGLDGRHDYEEMVGRAEQADSHACTVLRSFRAGNATEQQTLDAFARAGKRYAAWLASEAA